MDKNDRRKVVPRVCVIGGKAAPGYEIAKKIIKLCHAVAEKINNDTDIGDLLKLVSFKLQLLIFVCVFVILLSICWHFSLYSTTQDGPVKYTVFVLA